MANRTVTAELEMKGKDATGPAFKSIAARMGQMEKQFSRFNQTASQFNAKIKNIERSTGAFAKVSRGIETSTGMLMTGLKGFGAYAVANGVKQAVVSFADMERHMTRIGITAEASKGEVADATKEIERMSRSMGYSNFEPAMTALDTLVSSGMDLKTAMAFLPSVMATAQASGAETEDIANAGLKTASAFKLQAGEMQKAFDYMAYSGKQGQFELKDMSRYIPSLASSFAALGYTGQDGLKQLLAILQTIRSQTGTAEEAAADAQNIFGKVFSQETIGKFAKFGIDLDKELKSAKKNGEDLMHAFVRLSIEATKGDLSKLPQLFGDQQVRLGMLALINGLDETRRQLDALNNTRVSGTVLRDLNTVLDDTQAKLDRFAVSWDKYMKNVGGAAAGPVGKVLDIANNTMERGDAITAGIAKSGMSADDLTKYYIARGQGGSAEADRLDRYFAFLGDPNNERFRADYMADFADTPQMKKMLGRGQGYFMKPPGVPLDSGYTPKNLPTVGPYPMPGEAPRDQFFRETYANMGGRAHPMRDPYALSPQSPAMPDGSINAFAGFEERLQNAAPAAGKAIADEMQNSAPAAGKAIADQMQSSAPSIGEQIGNAILGVLSSFKPNINIGGYSRNQGVNANVGKPAAVTPPATFGPR